MNRCRVEYRSCQTGQGLVEFLFILPVTLVLLASISILLSLSVQYLWVDELLYTRLLMDEKVPVFDELSGGHGDSALPAYFSREDVQIRLNRQRNRAPGFSLHSFFPGIMSTIEVETRTGTRVHPVGGNLGGLPDIPAVTGRLGLLNLCGFRPEAIEDELRAITLGGMIPDALRVRLRRLGIEPVPLNINALPGQRE